MPDKHPTTMRGLRGIRRINMVHLLEHGVPTDGQPYVNDWRSFGIPETVAAGIRGAAAGLVAVSLSLCGGRRMIDAAEDAAKKRGCRVLWWIGPNIHDMPPEAQSRLRAYAKAAREKAYA